VQPPGQIKGKFFHFFGNNTTRMADWQLDLGPACRRNDTCCKMQLRFFKKKLLFTGRFCYGFLEVIFGQKKWTGTALRRAA
jgi:hypothetical protein